MEATDPRTPGIYYWCAIMGPKDSQRISAPYLVLLNAEGKVSYPESPLMGTGPVESEWPRMASTPQRARAIASNLLA